MSADRNSTPAAETGTRRHGAAPAGPPPVGTKVRKDASASACPLLRGDLEAWARCCTRRFLPIARGVTGDDELARDALQNSLLIVQAKLGQFRGGPVACSWIWTIVRREAARGGAARREVALHDQMAAPASTRPTPERELQTREMMGLLLQAIQQLPPRYQEVVRLRDLESHSTVDVAGRLHLTPSGVASRLQRDDAHRRIAPQTRVDRRVPGSVLRRRRLGDGEPEVPFVDRRATVSRSCGGRRCPACPRQGRDGRRLDVEVFRTDWGAVRLATGRPASACSCSIFISPLETRCSGMPDGTASGSSCRRHGLRRTAVGAGSHMRST